MPWKFSVLILAAFASEASAGSFIAPAEIDRAVANFLSAEPGQPGGARNPVDPRLRLAACPAPLAVTWFGRSGKTLEVSCQGPAWRVFVQVGAGPQSGPAAKGETLIQRGETVSLMVEGRGFLLTRQGEALEAGAMADWIKIRPTGEKAQTIRAQIAGPGAARLALP